MNKNCNICGAPFEGRRNKIYCSSRCRSEQNNGLFAERHEAEIKNEKALRKNRAILAGFYEFHESDELRLSALKKAKFDFDTNTGIGKRGETYYHDFTIKLISEHYFKIIKNQLK